MVSRLENITSSWRSTRMSGTVEDGTPMQAELGFNGVGSGLVWSQQGECLSLAML